MVFFLGLLKILIGVQTCLFWAEDSYGDRTRHEVNILINTTHFFTSAMPVKVAEACYEVMLMMRY
jgi:hypothetical protein